MQRGVMKNWMVPAILVLALLSIPFGMIFSAHQEARVFNKFSSSQEKATAWDAIFANLRVEACR